ncbi:gp53-like domain-containing protein [Escherichia coli]|uniref:gp53-like domain-containing protein n=1 Tax=Escherichia coli TaxID=562 RepID=UPI003D79FCFD
MAAIAALVDSSPDALNTLNELAAALGNDPNFATTMTNALAGKQPKDATLTALAELATSADKLPYFTGADRAALTALTSVGRAILGKTSTQGVLDYLGLRDAVTGTESMLRIPAFINGQPGTYVIQTQKLTSNTSSGLIVFPEAFNNKCMIIIAVDYASAAVDISRVRFNIPTKSQCEWFGQTMSVNPTPASPSSWAWMAIGY